MFGFFNKASDADIAQVKRALGNEAVVVLSASCCMPGTNEVDEQIEKAAQAALAAAKLDWPVLTVTVTTAQTILPKITSELNAAEGALAQQVSELFMAHGLSAFPIVIVDQKMLSYGGVPDQAMIQGALPNTTAPNVASGGAR
jgi:predicted regulator of amino acid metabolism with ACT domain